MKDQSGKYDVLIVGGGTAGANAARAAKEKGAGRVALIRNPAMPNTCVRQGCMPSKAVLAHAAKGLSFEQVFDHKQRVNFMGLESVLDKVPAKLLILGAAPIGLEAATFFSRLGSEVTIIEMLDRVLPFMDPEFGELRLRAAREPGAFSILAGSKMTSIEERGEGIRAKVAAGENEEKTFDADAILVATGRKPDLAGLQIEQIGLSLEKARISHDEKTFATKNPRVFLAGDATGHHQILLRNLAYARQRNLPKRPDVVPRHLIREIFSQGFKKPHSLRRPRRHRINPKACFGYNQTLQT